MIPMSARRPARWTPLGDLVAILGGGSTLAFFLANWWLPLMSPIPWLSDHGLAATLGAAVLIGLLLGLRAGRTGRAATHVLLALALGGVGFGLILSAPVTAGVLEAAQQQSIASFAVSRLVFSLFLAAPAGLLGAMVGAAVSEQEQAR